ncbi:hypothetical protein LTR99_007711 [Exophiala xenobiotica]|uniref:DUF3074 domain-containing protein n=1 Tax=Vermiconidia calcicola TaxID=1690605 RepID=A0AAV9Q6Z7_9PEZI|nr:hypothetical protein LTR99_007711 [Exophiala xenobiotica]KAK5535319.1 hypothetical protein LTR25_006327 [Vermiconidia calcicola]KAK5546820.1 hypothetical protein LTR23_003191 [Chaetothyriales sp. CCFEE 6169]KAK5373696.1 hypothetical protein LTS13_005895 [Exophiala xenobiotica]KAK5402376.1 hypothetical protein LTR79_001104 [Exophiala xenobiotica]
MSALHSALKALGPCDWSDIPQKPEELDLFLADLFEQAQCIVESIPIPDADPAQQSTKPTGSVASNASEITSSSARSPPPPPEYASLQKDWGKPIKLAAKENPLGISVYKTGSKDGKGSWFARRSVHEGLGFSRFKRGFEREFPTSLAVQGAPGEGNIRGIGAETRVEEITVPNRGKVEVYRLSAQFPGPTTPRDFVTLLATSSRAMQQHGNAHKSPDLAPRHYMIISKPCNHPETQPQNGFIRGQYESVEFIREIPRKLKATTSSTDLSSLGHHKESSLEKDVLKHNAEKQQASSEHDLNDNRHLQADTQGSERREPSPASRKRGATVGTPLSPTRNEHSGQHYDPEENPVEWIMVTRSDPGGSVPRFMVERGTPSSICSDAVKFLDWACQREDDEEFVDGPPPSRPKAQHRESFASWEANGTLAGIREHEESTHPKEAQTPKAVPQDSERPTPSPPGFMSTVAETLNSYTPQVVKDHIPNLTPSASPPVEAKQAEANQDSTQPVGQRGGELDDDAASSVSTLSFASAGSHLNSDEDPSISSKSLSEKTIDNQQLSQHDKDLAKLAERKAAMDAKFAEQREKLSSQASKDNEKDNEAMKKAQAKHEKELKKQEEKYNKEVAKLEQKKIKEAKKMEEKKRKQLDKDEKTRLTRERDEARAELELLKKEQEIFTRQIGELQKENTVLMAQIGKLEGGLPAHSPNSSPSQRLRAMTIGSEKENRNRSSSILSRGKNKTETSSEGS